MRTTKSGYFFSYWPAVLVVALVVIAVLRAYGERGAAYEPLPADRVTAELARAVSYGLIDASATGAAVSVRRRATPAATPEAS